MTNLFTLLLPTLLWPIIRWRTVENSDNTSHIRQKNEAKLCMSRRNGRFRLENSDCTGLSTCNSVGYFLSSPNEEEKPIDFCALDSGIISGVPRVSLDARLNISCPIQAAGRRAHETFRTRMRTMRNNILSMASVRRVDVLRVR